jgi:hypothetical protein
MNKKVVVAIAIVIVVALIVLAVVYAPSLTGAMLRMHGLR